MANQFSTSEIEQRFEASQNDLVLQSSDFSLQGLREMVENEVIDLSPKYQRRERWEVSRQSELIESFLLNIPVPPIYLSEEEYGIYSIIDGKQRITAVSDFLSNSFALRGLSEFPQINGMRFRNLPKNMQNALRVRPFLRVITLLKQSAPELKYEVFLRLNRGGVRLNPQEIRNVAFRGHLNDAIYATAEEAEFLKVALNISSHKSKNFQQMTDAEWVLRFLTLSENWEGFSGNFSKSMDRYMMENASVSKDTAEALAATFCDALERVSILWETRAFQRWDEEKGWRNQALAGMFDAQMISVHQLNQDQYQSLTPKVADIAEQTKALFLDPAFEEAVRLGTNTPSRMKLRVERTLDMLLSLA